MPRTHVHPPGLGQRNRADETFAAAPVREVREETGLEVRLIGLAGATAYERDGNAKPVVYFYADVVGPAAHKHPDNVPTEWLDLQS